VIPADKREKFLPKKATAPVIRVNGGLYVPVKKDVKPIVVEGKTYIPVRIAPSNVSVTNIVKPKTDEPVNTFKIGNKTYIPLEVVPKKF
jgi:hypothetical protein